MKLHFIIKRNSLQFTISPDYFNCKGSAEYLFSIVTEDITLSQCQGKLFHKDLINVRH